MKSKINANRALVAEKSKLTKLFTLFAVLLFGIGNVWGTGTELCSATLNGISSNSNTTGIAQTGCTMKWNSVTYSGSDVITIGTVNFYKFSGSSSYVQLVLTSGSFQAGDELTVTLCSNAGSGKTKSVQYSLHSDSGNKSEAQNVGSASPTDVAYTLVAADIESDGSIKIFRGGNTNIRFGSFSVTRAGGGGGSTDPVSSVSVAGATTGYATVPVALTATPDETATGYKWFVDGVEQDGKTSATFNFEAATPGTYSIIAKARNDNNETDEWIASDAHTVTISKLCGELIKIVQTGQSDGTVSGILTGTKDVKLSSGTSEYDEKTGRKIGSDNYWLGITGLSKPLRAGDVATVYVTTASAKLQLFSDKGTTLIGEMTSGVAQGENEIVLNSSATGKTAIYLYRTSATGSDMNPYVYSLSVNRSCTESDDCSISDVTINSEAITPVGKVYSYEVAAASALTEVAVTYSIHPLATAVPASGFTVAVPTAGDPANTQTITVTAEDGTHSDTYTISVSKATAASDVVTLDALAVTGYTLSPTFDAATLAYTITKDYGTADPTTDKVTYTKSEDAQKVEVNYDGTNHKFVVTVTAEDNTTTQDYEITINEAEAKRGLLTVPFSNGAKGAINVAGLEIRVPYIGTSEPTVVLANVEYQTGVSGASASMESDKLRITGADSNYDDYTLTFVQLTPSALTLDEEVTFDAVPSYAFAPYGWDSGKGVKFAKNVEDATPRVSSGNTRIYFAIQACDEVQLTSGSGGARNVKIYVNGVLSTVTSTAASGSAIKLALDNSQANFIAIESNQTGGDGGFTKILVKTLAANTLAYDDGAYTTGDAALDLSTLISTYNSDAAITYAVKTDGGTNASISGNNFTATAAGTAVITATQVASETICQASIDFNVVVTAGAAKYIVTYYDDATELGTEEVTEGEHPTATGIVTKKQGFNFLGWSETNGGAVVDLNGITISAAKNLYAKYEAIDCSGTGTKFKFQLKTDLTNGAVFTSAPGEVDLTTANYLSALVGGDVKVSLASGKNTNRVSFYDNKALGFANGDGATISITLTCPLATGDVVRYINYASSGNRMTLSDGTNTMNINGNGAETIQEIEVPAAWDGAYDLTLVRGGNTPKLTYFEIYRRPVLTAVALNDFTMRKGNKRTPELILTPEDGVVESQVWSITASTPADIATIDAATGEITATEAGEITVQVKLNDNDALVATCTVTIVDAIAQADVTKSTIWDWKNTGATANIQLSNSTDPKKNEGFVMANAAVNNDANFESDKLYIEGEYVVRDYDKTNPYFQGQNIKFNTTIAGLIQVTFSHTGNDKPARELYINGVGTGVSKTNATLEASGFFEVPAGEVSITAFHVDPADGASQQYIRISKIEFFALGYTRSVTEGNLATVCLPNACIARGVEVYELQGKEATYGKIVFDQLGADEVLGAGNAYLLSAKSSEAKFYFTTTPAVSTPDESNAMRGTFEAEGVTFQPGSAEAENVYFVKERALWSAKETGVKIGQYKAWVQMDAVTEPASPNPAPGRRRITLGVNGTNVATGLEDLEVGETPLKVMMNGQLFILRGEKIYDATGRLVK